MSTCSSKDCHFVSSNVMASMCHSSINLISASYRVVGHGRCLFVHTSPRSTGPVVALARGTRRSFAVVPSSVDWVGRLVLSSGCLGGLPILRLEFHEVESIPFGLERTVRLERRSTTGNLCGWFCKGSRSKCTPNQ